MGRYTSFFDQLLESLHPFPYDFVAARPKFWLANINAKPLAEIDGRCHSTLSQQSIIGLVEPWLTLSIQLVETQTEQEAKGVGVVVVG
jgi:hypothetical protein